MDRGGRERDGHVINKVPNKMLLVRLPPEVKNTV
jgi:hypothetical protein